MSSLAQKKKRIVPFGIISLIIHIHTLRALVITKRGREREKMEGREEVTRYDLSIL